MGMASFEHDGDAGVGWVADLPELRDRVGVFADRAEAGRVLAGMLERYRGSDALVLAIPAGGVPVAVVLAAELGLEMDVVVVSKVTPSWNSEVGYGAVAFNGTVRLNRAMMARLGIDEAEARAGIERTQEKVRRRVRALRGDRPLPKVTERTVILVDDGLASGFTMLVAAEAVREAGAAEVVVAAPTAHADTVPRLVAAADHIYIANLRGGLSFAVADAYRNWHDVSLEEAQRLLADARRGAADTEGRACTSTN